MAPVTVTLLLPLPGSDFPQVSLNQNLVFSVLFHIPRGIFF